MPPIHGFISAQTLEGMTDGTVLLRSWTNSGNLLGNHNSSHPDLESTWFTNFEDNILKDEPALQLYAGKTDWHYFHHPLLHEGETFKKRQAIRS